MKNEEILNKRIMKMMWILGITIVIFYLALVLLAFFTIDNEIILSTIVIISTLILIAICFYLVKIEVDTGYYECQSCHNKYIPTYLQAILAAHFLSSRYMKCPKCGNKNFAKKIMTKKE